MTRYANISKHEKAFRDSLKILADELESLANHKTKRLTIINDNVKIPRNGLNFLIWSTQKVTCRQQVYDVINRLVSLEFLTLNPSEQADQTITRYTRYNLDYEKILNERLKYVPHEKEKFNDLAFRLASRCYASRVCVSQPTPTKQIELPTTTKTNVNNN